MRHDAAEMKISPSAIVDQIRRLLSEAGNRAWWTFNSHAGLWEHPDRAQYLHVLRRPVATPEKASGP